MIIDCLCHLPPVTCTHPLPLFILSYSLHYTAYVDYRPEAASMLCYYRVVRCLSDLWTMLRCNWCVRE